MNIKKITDNLQDELYDDENLSLPFIISHNGKDMIAYLVFSCSDSDELLEITEIERLLIVDCGTNAVISDGKLPDFTYPIKISFGNSYSIDELDSLYKEYYKAIEGFIAKKASEYEYCRIADKVISADLRNLFKRLGAKYL